MTTCLLQMKHTNRWQDTTMSRRPERDKEFCYMIVKPVLRYLYLLVLES